LKKAGITTTSVQSKEVVMTKRLLSLQRLAGAMALASAVIGVPLAEARSNLIGGVPVDATIMRAGTTAPKISHLKHVPSIGVINLRLDSISMSRIIGDYTESIQDYRLTVERNAAGVNRLRAALKANPVTRRALADYGVSISRVVAVDIGSNGSLRVYVL
jgi:hypothetical protein